MNKKPRLFSVYLVRAPDAVGSELRKIRPGTVVSPDKYNAKSRTVVVALMTTGGRNRPGYAKVSTNFNGKEGFILLDQVHILDKSCLIKYLGELSKDEQQRLARAFGKFYPNK